MVRDRAGNKLTAKQFFKRWGEGIEGITPLQKIKTQITATRLQLIGLIAGLVVSILAWEVFWWLGIILLGGLINALVQYLGLTQQRNSLKKFEKGCKEIDVDKFFEELNNEEGENV